MIRRLMASTAMLALITSGAIGIAAAQDQPAVEQPAVVQDDAATTGSAATTDLAAGEADATLTPEEPTIATAFIGTSVYSSEDPESDNIGEVNDLIISDDGMITHAVVGVGGFLGIGEKDVTVPFDELQVIEQDGDIRLIYAATREQLEAAEEFDRTAYDPRGREAEEQALQEQAAAPADPMVPAEGTDTAAAPAEEQPLESTDTAAAPAEQPAESTDMAAAPAEEQPAESTDVTAAPAEEPTAESTDMAAAPAAEDPASTDATTAPAEEQVATAPAADAAATEGFVSFSTEQFRASQLIGEEVFSTEDESIGEIADLVLQDDGEAHAALIDVGGFLGVGEQRVAIPFDQIQITEDGEEARVAVALGRADLEQFPAYEDFGEETAATDAATDAATEEQTDVAATEEPAADDSAAEGAAMTGSATQGFSAAELMGAVVYSPEEENIGEVSDVVFDQGGIIEAVVVDVGGFLGVGEKPVALQFDALDVQEDESGEVRVTVNATQEQLEGAPAYQEEAAQ